MENIMTYEFKSGRTRAYLGTVDDRNHPIVQVYRDYVKQDNAGSSVKRYIKLQARGYRQGNRRYNQALPLKYGTHFDIYVYVR